MGTYSSDDLKEPPCGLWGRLDTEQKQQVVAAYTASARASGLDATVANEIAERLRFRPSMVRRARGKQASRLLLKAIAKGSDGIALTVLVHFCMNEAAEALSSIYDALGVEHSGIDVDDDASNSPLDQSAIDGALALARSDTSRQVALCFEVLNLRCFTPWKPTIQKIVQQLREQGLSIEQPIDVAADEPLPGQRISSIPRAPIDMEAGTANQSAPVAEVATENETELQYSKLTTLDEVLIRAVIAALNNVEGALDEDQLDDLIQETLELNDSRFQSYFHRGFLDSLTDRDCQRKGSGENDQSRAWYLVGYCQGLMRRRGTPVGAAFITALAAEDQEALLSPPVDAGVFLLPTIIRPLLDARHFSEAAQWLTTYLPAAAERVMPLVIRWARLALLESEPGQVAQILELCCSTIAKMPSRDNKELVEPLVNQMERRLAIALRLQGKPTAADSIIDRLLAGMSDEGARSKLLGDKLLIQMGMRSLADLRIQKKETREALGATFDRVAAPLDEAKNSSGTTSTVANLAAAIQVVLSETDATEALLPAIQCLNRALRALEMKNQQFWTDTGVLPRARFYLSVLELRLLDPAAAAPAATRLIGLLEDGLDEPLDLVVDAINHAVVQELPDADRLARVALGKWPQAVLAQLDLTGLVRRSSPFRKEIVDALVTNEERLTAKERWNAWHAVLKGALSADERDIEVAQQALDEMETLAEIHGFDTQFTELLREPANWDPAWAPMEADSARFRLLETKGKLVDARAALVNITHSAIGDSAYDPDELVEKLKKLGAEEETLSDLRARINASAMPQESEEAEEQQPDTPVSVLFIGGDERQQIYVQNITDALAVSHPSCEIRFEIPGWSSNWGREMDKYITAMEKAHAVVLMSFIRTNFGRQLRKAASETDTPWIACTGHGGESMLRSIKKAIRVAQQRTS